jgi:hypothetical protein
MRTYDEVEIESFFEKYPGLRESWADHCGMSSSDEHIIKIETLNQKVNSTGRFECTLGVQVGDKYTEIDVESCKPISEWE